MRNRDVLWGEGVAVPPPGRYRAVVRDTARTLKGRPASPEVQDALLDAIVDESASIDRLILSDPRFICINRLVIQGPQIWPMIDRQTTQLRALFPDDAVEFFIGLRDPATHVPQLFKTSRFSDFAEFTENMQVHAVAWSEMLRRLTMTHPDCPVTVWCNEDTPLIWGELLQDIAAVGMEVPLEGKDVLVQQIMDPGGLQPDAGISAPATARDRGAAPARGHRVPEPLRDRRPDRAGGEYSRLDRGFHGRPVCGL
jgi:hypothetical protein